VDSNKTIFRGAKTCWPTGVLTKEQRAELDLIVGSKYEPSDKDTIDMLKERLQK